MKKRMVALALAIGLLAAGCGGGRATGAGPVELNVSAAVSLKDALAEIGQKYREKQPNIQVVCNLGASGALQKQLEQGSPADIFISAAVKQMDELEAKGMLDKATRRNLLENRLVLVTGQDSALTKFEELAGDTVDKLSIGEPSSVPAGQYAEEMLRKLGVWDQVKPKTVLAKDVRTVLTYVETGNVQAGIVYQTDAMASKKVRVAAVAPAGSHAPIVYPLAILGRAKQRKAAEDFAAYLAGPEARAVFEKYGFSPVK